jgi:hypothetical protein
VARDGGASTWVGNWGEVFISWAAILTRVGGLADVIGDGGMRVVEGLEGEGK